MANERLPKCIESGKFQSNECRSNISEDKNRASGSDSPTREIRNDGQQCPGFPDQLYSQKQLRQMCGHVSNMTIWRMRKTNILPEPIVINGRNYWKRSVLALFFKQLGEDK